MPGTLRERIENDVFVYLATVALAAFGIGWGVYATIIAVSGQTTVSKDSLQSSKDSLQSLHQQNDTLQKENDDLRRKAQGGSSGSSSSGKTGSTKSNANVSGSVDRPEYTKEVDRFLKDWFEKGVPPKDGLDTGYQWMGYSADINKLNDLIKKFLDLLESNPGMPYSEALTFYDAIDEAASVISMNAEHSFIPEREKPPELQTANYNQKVFLGPTWFRIRLEQLRREHQRGHMDKALIADFRQRFLEWRQREGI